MSLLFLELMLVFILATGCASVTPSGSDLAVAVAKEEASRRGWKRVKVQSCRFVDGRWLVGVVRHPANVVGSDAIIEVSEEGNIISFTASER